MRCCRSALAKGTRLVARPAARHEPAVQAYRSTLCRGFSSQEPSEPSPEAVAQWRHYEELSRTDGSTRHGEVNRRYKAPLEHVKTPQCPLVNNYRGQMSDKHMQDTWSEEDINEAVRDHVIMTWVQSSTRFSTPRLVRGEGIYVYDSNGKEYMDMTSMAVCSNMGHSMDDSVRNAIVKQLEELPYAYSGLGMMEVRARLCSLMADITPGDINGFLFPLGGSEANEGAIRIARRYTGKYKVMSAMRSYHGGTTGPLAATGDFRARFAGEQPGFVKIFNPHALRFSTGDSDDDAAARCLQMLEEQILTEGPNTIAAILLETIVGANGVFLHPSGYMEGVRALCDQYEILLILDEVMCGFWRTGPLFAFQHFRGVVPDILTSAKGLTSSFLPLGMIGLRQKIKEHFESYPLGWGATYANHPVSMACAYEVVRRNCQDNMEEKVARIEEVMLEGVAGLVRRHSCVYQGRVIGAFGCLDLVNRKGESLNMLGEPLPPEALIVKESMARRGLFGLFRSPLLHICPPLIITEPELHEMFRRIDSVLTDLEAHIQ
mmetsp:Transcript_43868/g.136588  ORF Transcript_43868/g.136588 Transcript_43868/m.136588 type:complete len:547 (+) Transcript_43868:46-1686(+)